MVRGPRHQMKDHPKKRGPKSFLEQSKLPPRVGLKKRSQYRKSTKLSNATRKRYRTHWNLAWRLPKSRDYMKGLPNFKQTGYYKRNVHNGLMPSQGDEFSLTGRQAANILEKVATSEGVSYDQVKGTSGMLSYLYCLKTGISKENWKEVRGVMEDFHPADYEKNRVLMPMSIPTFAQLKKAFTTGWTINCGLTLARWISACLAAWCLFVWGDQTVT